MKKIVVMSDNHGQDSMLERIKELEPHADYYVHCGDSEASYQQLLTGYICVKGNNDWSLDLPMDAKLVVEGVHILITHGHFFGYFNREFAMQDALSKADCQLLFTGHTHIPMFIQEGVYTYINPGSTRLPRGGSRPSYAIVTIDNGRIECNFKDVK